MCALQHAARTNLSVLSTLPVDEVILTQSLKDLGLCWEAIAEETRPQQSRESTTSQKEEGGWGGLSVPARVAAPLYPPNALHLHSCGLAIDAVVEVPQDQRPHPL